MSLFFSDMCKLADFRWYDYAACIQLVYHFGILGWVRRGIILQNKMRPGWEQTLMIYQGVRADQMKPGLWKWTWALTCLSQVTHTWSPKEPFLIAVLHEDSVYCIHFPTAAISAVVAWSSLANLYRVSLVCGHHFPAPNSECSATLLLSFMPAWSDTLPSWDAASQAWLPGTGHIPGIRYGRCCPASWCWGWCTDDANETCRSWSFVIYSRPETSNRELGRIW